MIKFDQKLQLDLPDIMATQSLATALAQAVQPGLVIYLYGNLGSGKTTIVRAMLQALGITGSIKSPTYTLVESYGLDGMDLYHFDLYRIEDPKELELIGIRDYQLDNAVCIYEWADKGQGVIPKSDLDITLDFKEPGRSVSLQSHSQLGVSLLRKLTLG